MRQNLEEATIFFGRFAGDHRAFGSWKDGFIRKQKKIKFEAQQRIRRDVGGSGKQFYTPPSEYSPPVQKIEFVGKDLKCNRCQDDLESEANVIIHIKSVHIEEVRKMFAIDASEHLEADEEYHLWLNAITDVRFHNTHGFYHGTMGKTTIWQNPDTMTFAMVYVFCHTSMGFPIGYPITP